MIRPTPDAGETPNSKTWSMWKTFLSRLKDLRTPTTTSIPHSLLMSRKMKSLLLPEILTKRFSRTLVSSKF